MENQDKKILLVEDDPLILQIYKSRLQRAGFEVSSITSGGGVLERLKNEEFDLVLLDMVLPEESGFEILRKIYQKEGLKKTKVLVLSNIGEKTKVDKAFNMGVAGYLIKAHYTPSEVVNKIKELMNKD